MLRTALITILALTLAVFALACAQDNAPESARQLSTFSGEPAENPAPQIPAGIPDTPYIAQSQTSAALHTSPSQPVGSLASLPSISNLVHEIEPAVASISVESISRGMFFDFTDEGAGTGVVIRARRLHSDQLSRNPGRERHTGNARQRQDLRRKDSGTRHHHRPCGCQD